MKKLQQEEKAKMGKGILLTVAAMALLMAFTFSSAFGDDNVAPACGGPNAQALGNPGGSCVHPAINPQSFMKGLVGNANGEPKEAAAGGQAQSQPKIAMPVLPVNRPSSTPAKPPVVKQSFVENSHAGPGPIPAHSSGGYSGNIEELIPLMPAIESVLPEVPTPVALSGSDTNRFICPEGTEARDAGETDVIVSKEKGIVVKIVGRNVFIKFLERKSREQVALSSTPTDFFVVCGDIVYNVIGVPENMPSKTVRLVDGIDKVKKNVREYAGLSYEKKLVDVIKKMYKNDLPDSFTVHPVNTRIEMFDGLDIVLTRIVTVDGEGLTAKEFRINYAGKAPVELAEKDFLRGEFTTAAAAVIIDRLHLSKGDTARMIIVERSADNVSTK
jgi:conjugal transfer pilus assembly protein TraK